MPQTKREGSREGDANAGPSAETRGELVAEGAQPLTKKMWYGILERGFLRYKESMPSSECKSEPLCHARYGDLASSLVAEVQEYNATQQMPEGRPVAAGLLFTLARTKANDPDNVGASEEGSATVLRVIVKDASGAEEMKVETFRSSRSDEPYLEIAENYKDFLNDVPRLVKMLQAKTIDEAAAVGATVGCANELGRTPITCETAMTVRIALFPVGGRGRRLLHLCGGPVVEPEMSQFCLKNGISYYAESLFGLGDGSNDMGFACFDRKEVARTFLCRYLVQLKGELMNFKQSPERRWLPYDDTKLARFLTKFERGQSCDAWKKHLKKHLKSLLECYGFGDLWFVSADSAVGGDFDKLSDMAFIAGVARVFTSEVKRSTDSFVSKWKYCELSNAVTSEGGQERGSVLWAQKCISACKKEYANLEKTVEYVAYCRSNLSELVMSMYVTDGVSYVYPDRVGKDGWRSEIVAFNAVNTRFLGILEGTSGSDLKLRRSCDQILSAVSAGISDRVATCARAELLSYQDVLNELSSFGVDVKEARSLLAPFLKRQKKGRVVTEKPVGVVIQHSQGSINRGPRSLTALFRHYNGRMSALLGSRPIGEIASLLDEMCCSVCQELSGEDMTAYKGKGLDLLEAYLRSGASCGYTISDRLLGVFVDNLSRLLFALGSASNEGAAAESDKCLVRDQLRAMAFLVSGQAGVFIIEHVRKLKSLANDVTKDKGEREGKFRGSWGEMLARMQGPCDGAAVHEEEANTVLDESGASRATVGVVGVDQVVD